MADLAPTDFFYTDGTISLTNGSAIAVGQFTSWDTALLPYDFIVPGSGTNGLSIVASVEDATHLTLAKAWTGPTLTNVPYFALRWIKHTDPRVYGIQVAAYLTKLAALPADVPGLITSINASTAAILANASAAASSQSAAAGSASAAAGSASAASTSASNAATSYTNFRGIFYGPLASDPTLDPNGAALSVGDLYFNSTTNTMRVRTATAWTDATAQVSMNRWSKIATAGQAVFTGTGDAGSSPTTLALTPGFEIVMIDGKVVSPSNYTVTSSTITFSSGVPAGFEVSVYALTAVNLANTYTIAQADVTFTRKRNRILNPAMQISQEKGTAVVPAPAYVIDGWLVGLPAGSAVNGQQVTVAGRNRLRVTVATAVATLAAGDLFRVMSFLEGLQISDLQFGTASAKNLVARFGFKGPAGTYAFHITNGTRAYVVPFTISAGQANTDTLQTFVIPGDVAGTWVTDNTPGLQFIITLGAGATYQGAASQWNATYIAAAAGQTNGAASTANVFEIFDAGLYEGAVIPPFEVPDYGQALEECQRYFIAFGGEATAETVGVGWNASASIGVYAVHLPRKMRVPPALSYSALAHWGASNTGGGPIALTALSLEQAATLVPTIRADVAAGSLVAGQGGRLMAANTVAARLYLNARL